MMLIVVVLPQPDLPNNATTPGAGASNSAFRANPSRRLATLTFSIAGLSDLKGDGYGGRAVPPAAGRSVRAQMTESPAAVPDRHRLGIELRCRAPMEWCV